MKPERESPRTGERKTAGTKATVALAGKERVGDTPAMPLPTIGDLLMSEKKSH